ncbi:MAG: hypothetical protein GQ474_01730, partial [Sulfurimonas sp.]|nr:hypothetical protein [Sulfurimonas sp.]
TEDTNNDGSISNTELVGKVDVTIDIPAGATTADTLNVTNPDGTISNVAITTDMITNGYKTSYDTPADGATITVSATVTDAAGNKSTSSTDSAIIGDTTNPEIQDQTFSYVENQLANSEVAVVSATDLVGVTGDTFATPHASDDQLSADGFYAIDNDGKITITAAGVASGVNDYETGSNTGDYDVIATDAAGNTQTATITLKETNINEATTTVADTGSTNEDIVLTVTAANGVLKNDNDPDDVLEVSTFTVAGDSTVYTVGQTATITDKGTITLNADGGYPFPPVTNYSGDIPVVTYKTNTGSTDTLTIDVTAVADSPTLNVTSDTTTSQSITISNVNTTNNGFEVKALNADGSDSTISTHSGPDGFGVTGSASGADSELGYKNGVGSESLVLTFDTDVTSVDISFAWKHSGENASYTFYKDGQVVGTGTSIGGSDGVDPAVTLKPDNGSDFDKIVFSAPGSDDDYLIHSITYDKVEVVSGPLVVDEEDSVEFSIASALTDTDGSESLKVELKDIPVGFTVSDGTNTFTATASTTSVDITNWTQSSMTLLAANVSDTTTYTLNVVSTSTEASNGDAASTTKPLVVTVLDSSPTAVADNDSVGFGGIAYGNVITGEGGLAADIIGKDSVELTSINFNNNVYNFGQNNSLEIDSEYGKLTVNKDGSYNYDSYLVSGSASGNSLDAWKNQDGIFYGAGDSIINPNGSLNLSGLPSSYDGVGFNNGADSLGVVGSTQSARINPTEQFIYNFEGSANKIDITIQDLSDSETVEYSLFDKDGNLVESGTLAGNGSDVLSIDLSSTGKTAQYISISATDDSTGGFRIQNVSFDSVNVDPETFTYYIIDSDGDADNSTLTIQHDKDLTPVDDTATVYESGLADGTEASSNKEFVTGNLFDNDNGVGANAVITQISSNSNTDSSADSNGLLTINTQYGDITVYTQDYNGHRAGDYEYELTDVTNGDNIVDSIKYKVNDGSGSTSEATLNVSIVDDAPIGSNIHSHLEDLNATSQTT